MLNAVLNNFSRAKTQIQIVHIITTFEIHFAKQNDNNCRNGAVVERYALSFNCAKTVK